MCTVQTVDTRTDIVTKLFCFVLEIGIGNDIEIGHLEFDTTKINVSIKITNTLRQTLQEDVFEIDNNFCYDDTISEPITHERRKTVTLCSKDITSGFYQAKVQVSGLNIRARHKDGQVSMEECENIDSDKYRAMSFRYPMKNLNACDDIMVCAEHVYCKNGFCPYPRCKRSCRSLMYGDGNSVYCNNQLTLHPHSLIMNVANFLYVPEENSICYEISEYDEKRYRIKNRNEVEDYTIQLENSIINIAGQGIGENGYKFWSLGKPSSFCESQPFLHKQFMENGKRRFLYFVKYNFLENGQYVCVKMIPDKSVNPLTDSVVYHDTLRYTVMPRNGKTIQFSSSSNQINYNIQRTQKVSLNKRLSEMVKEKVIWFFIKFILFLHFFLMMYLFLSFFSGM